MLSYYKLKKSVHELGVISANNKIRLFDFFTGFSSNKSFRFVTHAETLVLEGGPLILSTLDKE